MDIVVSVYHCHCDMMELEGTAVMCYDVVAADMGAVVDMMN